MKRIILTATFISMSLLGASAGGIRPGSPPAALQRPVVDHYPGGHLLTDPYRYLENLKSPVVQSYFKAQADYANAVLARLGPGRERIRRDVARLIDSGTFVSGIIRSRDRIFYTSLPPGASDSKLMVRIGSASPRMLVDPDTLGKQLKVSAHLSISQVLPSPDGTRVSVSFVPGGSEFDTFTRFINVATGAIEPDILKHTWFGVTSWTSDGMAVYYNNPPKIALEPGHEKERELNNQTFVHVLGSRKPDTLTFGSGVDPKVSFVPIDTPSIAVPIGSDYVLGGINHGVRNEVTAYAAPASALAAGGTIPWRKIVDVEDSVTGYDVHGNSLFLLTHKDAPTFRVTMLDLSKPGATAANAPTVVAASALVIKQVAVAKDGLYMLGIVNGIARIEKAPWNPDGTLGALVDVPLPFKGSLADFAPDPRADGAVLRLASWAKPSRIYTLGGGGTLADTGISKPPKIDVTPYVSLEVSVPSTDGAMVPVSITMTRGQRLDGSAPVYLEAYGSYGLDIDPAFIGPYLAWINAGGIYVVAHVRGGGEKGQAWYLGGKGPTKQHTIDDAIATARWLIANKYTSPKHLAIEGTSAGGIMVGGAITQHPELFAAAIDGVGVTDALRSAAEPNGPTNFPEFGDPGTSDGFNDLYKMDAYQHIKDGIAYPAVMGITGINDPRVAPWQVAKFTTRLQHASSSGRPVLMRVDYDGGHGLLAASSKQAIALLTDEFSFLLWQCKSPLFAGIPTRRVP